MGKYSAIVMDHFLRPRNFGTLEPPAFVGSGKSASGAPQVEIYLGVHGGRVETARFKAFGCGATIAAASMLTEMVSNQLLTECSRIGEADLVAALGGLPPEKTHCAVAAISALRSAIATAQA